MSLIGNVNSGNNPYAGGSKTPNAPPPALGGTIASANTNNTPEGGVNPPGQPFYARNNEGSNIGIPYTRLVPLSGKRYSTGLVVDNAGEGFRYLGGYGAADPTPDDRGGLVRGTQQTITETEDMRASRVGFILGRRSVNNGVSQLMPKGRAARPAGSAGPVAPLTSTPDDYGADDYSRFISGGDSINGMLGVRQTPGDSNFLYAWMAPGMSGTERFQKMCSLEFLQAYFATVLRNKRIVLQKLVIPQAADIPSEGIVGTAIGRAFKTAAGYNAAFVCSFVPTSDAVRAIMADETNILDMKDIAPALGDDNSNLKNAGDPVKGGEERKQGVFPHDAGPFLRGKGIVNTMLDGTVGGFPTKGSGPFSKQRAAFRVSRNLGDEIAFDILDKAMEEAGLTDWRPDGIVLSKGANDPSDRLSDEFFEARDGQLYNMRIQGPAHTTTWTGDPAMEVLPGDKVFIVIVADVWFDSDSLDGDAAPIKAWINNPTAANWNAYAEARNKHFKEKLLTKDRLANFKNESEADFKGTDIETRKTVLTNFRVTTTTSSQMVNYSPWKWMNSEDPANPERMRQVVDRDQANERVTLIQGASRMGLRMTMEGGEYIVGGWQIGTVLDSAASRAVMPGGSLGVGVRTAPNTMAHNVYVNIGWWSADRLWRSFMNVENSVKPRYVKRTAGDEPKDPVNIPAGKANSAHG